MDANEIVVHMKQRQHSDVIFEILTEGVRQPGEPPQAKDGAFRYASKAKRRADGAPLDQSRKHRDFLLEADYVCHDSSIRQRFRIVKRQTKKERKLCGFIGVRPPRLRCFSGASASLFVGHGFKTTLPADSAPLGPHLPHDLLDDGKLYGFRQGDGIQRYPASVLDGIEVFCFASPLWHTSSVARIEAARQEVGISNRPTTDFQLQSD
jgi:hypothetical protein